ncbi:MAG: hypothetical protein ACXAEU_21690, partial [Candidatus Hodarchaeales archaeon]
MKKIVLTSLLISILVASVVGSFIGHGITPSIPLATVARTNAEEIGPGTLPDWHTDAQVQLGWIFEDPINPQDSSPLTGWDK